MKQWTTIIMYLEPLKQKRKPDNEDVLLQRCEQFTNSTVVEIEWRKSQACKS